MKRCILYWELWRQLYAHTHLLKNMRALHNTFSRMSYFQVWFGAHLDETNETYGVHALEACWVGIRMLAGGAAAMCHAIIPGVFTSTASSIAAQVAADVAARKKKKD